MEKRDLSRRKIILLLSHSDGKIGFVQNDRSETCDTFYIVRNETKK